MSYFDNLVSIGYYDIYTARDFIVHSQPGVN